MRETSRAMDKKPLGNNNMIKDIGATLNVWKY
jgi:hypothetical protein